MKTAWTGCIPTVRTRSAARWTGTQVQEGDFASVQRLYHRVRPARNAPACSPPAAHVITKRSWQRNWVKSTILKCGVPARLPARCVPSNRTRSLPRAPRVSPDARRTNVRAKFQSRWSNPAAFVLVAQAGSLPCRRLVIGRWYGARKTCRLPTCDTADYQSAPPRFNLPTNPDRPRRPC